MFYYFSEAQGQLTLQLVVASGRNYNSSNLLWLSSLHARMKKIQSKMKALECSQHFSHYPCQLFIPVIPVRGQIAPNFQLIQDFVAVLVTCKNEKDPIKMKVLECSQHFSHYKSMGIFPEAQGRQTLQSVV